jgi:hypothetical protein
MSKGGERTQGKPGGPIPLGYGRSVFMGVAEFSSPLTEAHVKLPNYVVSGITKDSTGTPVANCHVDVFRTLDDVLVGDGNSDANGAYSIPVNAPDTGLKFYAIAYKAGAPDIAGITVNTLQGVEL